MNYLRTFALVFLVSLGCAPDDEKVSMQATACMENIDCPHGQKCCGGTCMDSCNGGGEDLLPTRPGEDLLPTRPGEDVSGGDVEPDFGEDESGEDVESDSGEDVESDSGEDVEPDSGEDVEPDSGEDVEPDIEVGEWGCSEDICTDSVTGLLWERLSPITTVNYYDAVSHCDGLLLGGYNDWRLPTVTELRTVVRGCENTALEGPCQVSDYCIAGTCANYPCYGCSPYAGPGTGGCYWPDEFGGSALCGWGIWSSTREMDTPAQRRWVVSYHNANIFVREEDRDNGGVVRCVRSDELE